MLVIWLKGRSALPCAYWCCRLTTLACSATVYMGTLESVACDKSVCQELPTIPTELQRSTTVELHLRFSLGGGFPFCFEFLVFITNPVLVPHFTIVRKSYIWGVAIGISYSHNGNIGALCSICKQMVLGNYLFLQLDSFCSVDMSAEILANLLMVEWRPII